MINAQGSNFVEIKRHSMQGIPTIGEDGTKKEYGQHLVDAGCSHWRPEGEIDIPIPGKLNIILSMFTGYSVFE